jgi:hypothetical protein
MSTIEVAILFPAVLLWLMLIVQYGLWWHAKQIANAAAAEAVERAQQATGSASEGERAAANYLHEAGNLAHTRITVDRSPTVVTAEVRGDAPQLVPGFAWTVTARGTAPVERFVPQDQR